MQSSKHGADDEDEDFHSFTLKDFEMLEAQESLGKGSFGVVQKIRRKGSQKVYALKSMKKLEVWDSNLVQQVELEIEVQRKLKHKNVLRLHRHFEDVDTVFLLLEFCAKGELYQILRTQKCRRFSEEKACDFFCQAAEGLMYLHNYNVVHRDIKPENLLVTADDVLKIADFGWCAVFQSSSLRTTFCGTLDYLAPEMIQGKGHDHTLDVWSAGVLLYEMVVGRPPFQSTNHAQLITKILTLDLNFPETIAKPELQDLVRRLLRREPRDRLALQDAVRHEWVLTQKDKSRLTDKSADISASPLPSNRQVDLRHAATGPGSDMARPTRTPEQKFRSPDIRYRRISEVKVDISADISLRSTGRESFEEEQPEMEPSTKTSVNARQRTEAFVAPAPWERVRPAAPSTALPPAAAAAMATRGLQSPRVPGGPYIPQPVAINRPNAALPATAPGPVTQYRLSPTSTPLINHRPPPDAAVQIVMERTAETDELSRTYGRSRTPAIPSMPPTDEHLAATSQRRAPSVIRPTMQMNTMPETPGQSVVYRPVLLPSGSPVQQHGRNLDGATGSASGTGQHREAPGTPNQRAAFRARTMSPDFQGGETAESIRRALPGRGASTSQSAARHPGEPLHHASSQQALQRGGARPSSGGVIESSRPHYPQSPKQQTRRLPSAQPASVELGIGGAGPVPTGRIPGTGAHTSAGVLASPYPTPGSAKRGTRPEMEQARHSNLHNVSLGDDDQMNASRCGVITEENDIEVPSAASARARRGRSTAPGAFNPAMARIPGTGPSLARPQMSAPVSRHHSMLGHPQTRVAGGAGLPLAAPSLQPYINAAAPSYNRRPLTFAAR